MKKRQFKSGVEKGRRSKTDVEGKAAPNAANVSKKDSKEEHKKKRKRKKENISCEKLDLESAVFNKLKDDKYKSSVKKISLAEANAGREGGSAELSDPLLFEDCKRFCVEKEEELATLRNTFEQAKQCLDCFREGRGNAIGQSSATSSPKQMESRDCVKIFFFQQENNPSNRRWSASSENSNNYKRRKNLKKVERSTSSSSRTSSKKTRFNENHENEVDNNSGNFLTNCSSQSNLDTWLPIKLMHNNKGNNPCRHTIMTCPKCEQNVKDGKENVDINSYNRQENLDINESKRKGNNSQSINTSTENSSPPNYKNISGNCPENETVLRNIGTVDSRPAANSRTSGESLESRVIKEPSSSSFLSESIVPEAGRFFNKPITENSQKIKSLVYKDCKCCRKQNSQLDCRLQNKKIQTSDPECSSETNIGSSSMNLEKSKCIQKHIYVCFNEENKGRMTDPLCDLKSDGETPNQITSSNIDETVDSTKSTFCQVCQGSSWSTGNDKNLSTRKTTRDSMTGGIKADGSNKSKFVYSSTESCKFMGKSQSAGEAAKNVPSQSGHICLNLKVNKEKLVGFTSASEILSSDNAMVIDHRTDSKCNRPSGNLSGSLDRDRVCRKSDGAEGTSSKQCQKCSRTFINVKKNSFSDSKSTRLSKECGFANDSKSTQLSKECGFANDSKSTRLSKECGFANDSTSTQLSKECGFANDSKSTRLSKECGFANDSKSTRLSKECGFANDSKSTQLSKECGFANDSQKMSKDRAVDWGSLNQPSCLPKSENKSENKTLETESCVTYSGKTTSSKGEERSRIQSPEEIDSCVVELEHRQRLKNNLQIELQDLLVSKNKPTNSDCKFKQLNTISSLKEARIPDVSQGCELRRVVLSFESISKDDVKSQDVESWILETTQFTKGNSSSGKENQFDSKIIKFERLKLPSASKSMEIVKTLKEESNKLESCILEGQRQPVQSNTPKADRLKLTIVNEKCTIVEKILSSDLCVLETLQLPIKESENKISFAKEWLKRNANPESGKCSKGKSSSEFSKDDKNCSEGVNKKTKSLTGCNKCRKEPLKNQCNKSESQIMESILLGGTSTGHRGSEEVLKKVTGGTGKCSYFDKRPKETGSSLLVPLVLKRRSDHLNTASRKGSVEEERNKFSNGSDLSCYYDLCSCADCMESHKYKSDSCLLETTLGNVDSKRDGVNASVSLNPPNMWEDCETSSSQLTTYYLRDSENIKGSRSFEDNNTLNSDLYDLIRVTSEFSSMNSLTTQSDTCLYRPYKSRGQCCSYNSRNENKGENICQSITYKVRQGSNKYNKFHYLMKSFSDETHACPLQSVQELPGQVERENVICNESKDLISLMQNLYSSLDFCPKEENSKQRCSSKFDNNKNSVNSISVSTCCFDDIGESVTREINFESLCSESGAENKSSSKTSSSNKIDIRQLADIDSKVDTTKSTADNSDLNEFNKSCKKDQLKGNTKICSNYPSSSDFSPDPCDVLKNLSCCSDLTWQTERIKCHDQELSSFELYPEVELPNHLSCETGVAQTDNLNCRVDQCSSLDLCPEAKVLIDSSCDYVLERKETVCSEEVFSLSDPCLELPKVQFCNGEIDQTKEIKNKGGKLTSEVINLSTFDSPCKDSGEPLSIEKSQELPELSPRSKSEKKSYFEKANLSKKNSKVESKSLNCSSTSSDVEIIKEMENINLINDDLKSLENFNRRFKPSNYSPNLFDPCSSVKGKSSNLKREISNKEKIQIQKMKDKNLTQDSLKKMETIMLDDNKYSSKQSKYSNQKTPSYNIQCSFGSDSSDKENIERVEISERSLLNEQLLKIKLFLNKGNISSQKSDNISNINKYSTCQRRLDSSCNSEIDSAKFYEQQKGSKNGVNSSSSCSQIFLTLEDKVKRKPMKAVISENNDKRYLLRNIWEFVIKKLLNVEGDCPWVTENDVLGKELKSLIQNEGSLKENLITMKDSGNSSEGKGTPLEESTCYLQETEDNPEESENDAQKGKRNLNINDCSDVRDVSNKNSNCLKGNPLKAPFKGPLLPNMFPLDKGSVKMFQNSDQFIPGKCKKNNFITIEGKSKNNKREDSRNREGKTRLAPSSTSEELERKQPRRGSLKRSDIPDRSLRFDDFTPIPRQGVLNLTKLNNVTEKGKDLNEIETSKSDCDLNFTDCSFAKSVSYIDLSSDKSDRRCVKNMANSDFTGTENAQNIKKNKFPFHRKLRDQQQLNRARKEVQIFDEDKSKTAERVKKYSNRCCCCKKYPEKEEKIKEGKTGIYNNYSEVTEVSSSVTNTTGSAKESFNSSEPIKSDLSFNDFNNLRLMKEGILNRNKNLRLKEQKDLMCTNQEVEQYSGRDRRNKFGCADETIVKYRYSEESGEVEESAHREHLSLEKKGKAYIIGGVKINKLVSPSDMIQSSFAHENCNSEGLDAPRLTSGVASNDIWFQEDCNLLDEHTPRRGILSGSKQCLPDCICKENTNKFEYKNHQTLGPKRKRKGESNYCDSCGLSESTRNSSRKKRAHKEGIMKDVENIEEIDSIVLNKLPRPLDDHMCSDFRGRWSCKRHLDNKFYKFVPDIDEITCQRMMPYRSPEINPNLFETKFIKKDKGKKCVAIRESSQTGKEDLPANYDKTVSHNRLYFLQHEMRKELNDQDIKNCANKEPHAVQDLKNVSPKINLKFFDQKNKLEFLNSNIEKDICNRKGKVINVDMNKCPLKYKKSGDISFEKSFSSPDYGLFEGETPSEFCRSFVPREGNLKRKQSKKFDFRNESLSLTSCTPEKEKSLDIGHSDKCSILDHTKFASPFDFKEYKSEIEHGIILNESATKDESKCVVAAEQKSPPNGGTPINQGTSQMRLEVCGQFEETIILPKIQNDFISLDPYNQESVNASICSASICSSAINKDVAKTKCDSQCKPHHDSGKPKRVTVNESLNKYSTVNPMEKKSPVRSRTEQTGMNLFSQGRIVGSLSSKQNLPYSRIYSKNEVNPTKTRSLSTRTNSTLPGKDKLSSLTKSNLRSSNVVTSEEPKVKESEIKDQTSLCGKSNSPNRSLPPNCNKNILSQPAIIPRTCKKDIKNIKTRKSSSPSSNKEKGKMNSSITDKSRQPCKASSVKLNSKGGFSDRLPKRNQELNKKK